MPTQDPGMTPERMVQMFKTAQASEARLRHQYGRLIASANLGGVSSVLVRRYNEAAAQLNDVITKTAEFLKEAGQPAKVELIYAPIIQTAAGGVPALSQAGVPAVYPTAELRFGAFRLAAQPLGGLARALLIVAIFAGGSIAIVSTICSIEQARKQAVLLAAIEARARISDNQTRQLEILVNKAESLTKACAGDDTGKFLECLKAVAGALLSFEQSLPDPRTEWPPSEPKKGLGVFGWIGVITVVAALSIGGWWVWQQRRRALAARSKAGEGPLRREVEGTTDNLISGG